MFQKICKGFLDSCDTDDRQAFGLADGRILCTRLGVIKQPRRYDADVVRRPPYRFRHLYHPPNRPWITYMWLLTIDQLMWIFNLVFGQSTYLPSSVLLGTRL